MRKLLKINTLFGWRGRRAAFLDAACAKFAPQAPMGTDIAWLKGNTLR
jgi:hypothetical protein